MRRIDCSCHMWGDRFSPCAAEKLTGLSFAHKEEPGQIGTSRPHLGTPLPYGSGTLKFGQVWDCSEPSFLKWLNDIKKSIPAFRQAGAEDITLDFFVVYNYQCNLEAEPDFFLALGQLGIPVTMSCWVDENLPEDDLDSE